uniref:t-SNARE coiled-coil homology domain-containing protein n=1 Tax=Phytophthora ramorum TaxID=164328 RepID=H3GFH3_PHYRM
MANGRSTARDTLFSGASSRTQVRNGHWQVGGSVDNGEQAKRLLEDQNDEQISHLSLQITQLKQLSGNIHSEVVDQNRFLDGMGKEFDNTEGLLGGTMKRLGIMMDQGGSKHMLYLILFVVVVFVLLYFAIRSH